eukprot:354510-Chlamydomonas_euryale.AAC.2
MVAPLFGTFSEIRAAAAERALDRQALRDAIKNLAPLDFNKPPQVGRMTRETCVDPTYNSCPSSINNIQARLLPRRAMVAESVAVLLGHQYIDFSHPVLRDAAC